MTPTIQAMDQVMKTDGSLSRPEISEKVLKNQTNWFDYMAAHPLIKRAISTHETSAGTRFRREQRVRDLNLDNQEEREKKTILADETVIPIRVVDTNIRRETPRYVNYLMGGRLVALTPDGGESSTQVIEALEKRHHELMTYPGWLDPWFQVIDGACAHGIDFLEVVYDTTKPGHVSIEHIGVNNLIIPQKIKKVQQAPLILRKYELSVDDLRMYRDKFGFTAVDELLSLLPPAVLLEGETTPVFKLMFRMNDVVHVAWYSDKLNDKYLKDPAPLYLGISEKVMVDQPPLMQPQMVQTEQGMTMTEVPVPQEPLTTWQPVLIKEYPIVGYRYYITERGELDQARGRVYNDQHYQTALTTTWTSFINAMVRSSGTYACEEQSQNPSSKLTVSSIKLQHGLIYEKPLKFFAPPPPDANMLPMVQALYAQTTQEAGHFDYASRDKGGKTRPTATEVESSSETTQQYSSVGLAMFSEAVREVYTLTWRIMSSLAEQDEIFLYGVRQMVEAPDGSGLVEIIKNDLLTVKQPYIIRAAGDVDVVQRQQRIQKLLQFWPIVATTPLASTYLAKMLRVALPEDGEQFAQVILSTNAMPPAELVAGLLNLVKASVSPEEAQALPPEEAQNLQQLLTSAEQYVSAQPTAAGDASPAPQNSMG